MRDLIKTERARKIINFLTGKIVRITENGVSREKIVTGIYGVGECVEMKQVCIRFKADFRKDDGGLCCMQLYYEDWEELISKGRWGDDDFAVLELEF